jgi:hypothetical protein
MAPFASSFRKGVCTMVLSSWLKPFRRWKGQRCNSRRQKARAWLRLEQLESRDVPALFIVTTLTDGDPGSLRDAINQANASPGHNDINFKVSGTCFLTQGQLDITNGDLTIDAQGQTEVVDAGQNSRVLEINAGIKDTTTLIGLTITNGNVGNDDGGDIRVDGGNLTLSGTTVSNASPYNGPYATNGGGIYMGPSSGQLIVSAGSLIENNSAVYGGGIYSANGDLIVDNSTITGNSASADGGGIYTTGLAGPTTTVSNSTISNNAAWSGNGGGIFSGGILLPDGTYTGVVTNIDQSTFEKNSAGYSPYTWPTGYGGGLAQFNVPAPDPSVPSLSVTRSTFSSNSAGIGGGIAVESSDLADGQTRIANIVRCVFENNTVIRDGGGVYMAGHWATDGYWLWPADYDTIRGSTFTNNTAGTDLPYPDNWGGDGGGLFCDEAENSTVLNSTFTGNQVLHGDFVHGTGGAIRGGDFLDVENCLIQNNSALRGGGISDETIDSIFLQALRIYQTVISDNTATEGGCGGLFSSNDNTTITESTIHHNSAQMSGGGACFYPPDSWSTLTITASTIDHNIAGLNADPHPLPWVGGGIWIITPTTTTITNCTIADNSVMNAGNGGGMYIEGANSSTVLVDYCTIAENHADTGYGGGVYNAQNSPSAAVYFHASIVALNTAPTSPTVNGPDVWGPIISLGYNLIGNGDGSSGWNTTNDLVGTTAAPIDPMLDPLGNYGGPTQTMRLRRGSPALYSGDPNDFPATDQRGMPRPGGGEFAPCRGAFERQPSDG